MDQNQRPEYYEGQYLGAEDLAAIVRFARTAQARHALGAHTWGIGVGLELVERPLPGGDVEITLTPGYGCDGVGRNLVALAPTKIGLTQFESLQDTTDPFGTPLEIWISYHELPARQPGEGFASCREDAPFARVIESFKIEIRRPPVSEYRAVVVAGRTLDAKAAVSAFKPGGAALYDETVPYQELPDKGDKPRWALFIGIVRWLKATNQSGRLIKRTDLDLDATRRGRRYLGAVAETILAPDGVLRLRDRTKDPDDNALNFQPPIVKPAPGVVPDNDLVWVEGNLRVIGDARLVAGKLDYRVERGGNDDIPMWLRRIKDTSTPTSKVTLEAAIGPPTLLNTQTRFAVSSLSPPGTSIERLTVITDGRVGVNAPDPTNTLQVSGATGIRQGVGYVSGDEAAGWTSVSLNAFFKTGNTWQFPDPVRTSATILLEEAAGVPAIKMMTNLDHDPAKWALRMIVKGNTGNVGIGEANPTGLLHLAKGAEGYIKLFTPGADVEYDGGTDKLFVFKDTGGTTAFMGGNVGIGTTAPTHKLDVSGGLHVTGVARKETLGGWVTPSDVSLKKDVAALSDALGTLLRLKGVEFSWREPERHGATTGKYAGFIAQEVEKVFPQWVETMDSGLKALNTIGLDALFVEALRELNAKCERLESELRSLREENASYREPRDAPGTAAEHHEPDEAVPPKRPRPRRHPKK